ncbi:YqaE/Pmp3 family membrane protein [bacterium]|nr:YqaE/Pmp3 family membrane protein [bacterium]
MNKILMIIVAIVIPPVAVALTKGFGLHFWLNIILCLLFWLPASIHAVLVVLMKDGTIKI